MKASIVVIFAVIFSVMIAGCGSSEPSIEYRDRIVPVPVPKIVEKNVPVMVKDPADSARLYQQMKITDSLNTAIDSLVRARTGRPMQRVFEAQKVTERGDTVGARFHLSSNPFFDLWASYKPIDFKIRDTVEVRLPPADVPSVVVWGYRAQGFAFSAVALFIIGIIIKFRSTIGKLFNIGG